MTAIVGVPGAGNYVSGQPPDKVAARRSEDWTASVAAGLGIGPDALDLTVAYYAPFLHPGQPISQTAVLDPDRTLDYLDPDTDALTCCWLEALDLPDITVEGRLAVPLRHAVVAAANRFSLNARLTKLFVALCFREVARYLAADDAPARAQARDQVAATIADRRARVVIAHSLGTVVAYEALHAHPGLQVDLLVTLGSPLALPGAVFDRLHPRPNSGIGRRPANVRRWVNISDYGDPIAILRPFTTYFPSVDLDLTESVGLFDFHRAARYLACASLAATLRPLLDLNLTSSDGSPSRPGKLKVVGPPVPNDDLADATRNQAIKRHAKSDRTARYAR
jgi:hypothetical protein